MNGCHVNFSPGSRPVWIETENISWKFEKLSYIRNTAANITTGHLTGNPVGFGSEAAQEDQHN
jgi:hypothetical protein